MKTRSIKKVRLSFFISINWNKFESEICEKFVNKFIKLLLI